jgi:hypothetical protein
MEFFEVLCKIQDLHPFLKRLKVMSSEMNLAESAFVHIKAFIKGGGAEI